MVLSTTELGNCYNIEPHYTPQALTLRENSSYVILMQCLTLEVKGLNSEPHVTQRLTLGVNG